MTQNTKTGNQPTKALLLEVGLTQEQSAVYSDLILNGPAQARRIMKNTGIKRSLVYKVLGELSDQLLVIKNETDTKVAVFYPEHPSRLKEIARSKEEEVEKMRAMLQSSLGSLVSSFNVFCGKPNVQFFEGAGAIKRLHEDILNEGQNIMLLRSINDKPSDMHLAELEAHIEAQAVQGIHTRAITPMVPYLEAALRDDRKRLVERRIIPAEDFSLMSQVTIYAQKVAFMSFDATPHLIIVESPTIFETFKTVFEYMWISADKPELSERLKDLTKLGSV